MAGCMTERLFADIGLKLGSYIRWAVAQEFADSDTPARIVRDLCGCKTEATVFQWRLSYSAFHNENRKGND